MGNRFTKKSSNTMEYQDLKDMSLQQAKVFAIEYVILHENNLQPEFRSPQKIAEKKAKILALRETEDIMRFKVQLDLQSTGFL